MEGLTRRRFWFKEKLRDLFLYYVLAGCFFLILLASAIVTDQYIDSLQETLAKLRAMKVGLIKIRDATVDMNKSIAMLNTMVPSDFFSDSPDRLIILSLDEMKSNLKNAEITVSELTDKEKEIGLPVAIKGLLRDYSVFINDIGYLQSMRFPFYSIFSLTIRRLEEAGQGIVLYEMNGELKLPKAAPLKDVTTIKNGTT